MPGKNIDVFLNAYNNTGPATSAAAGNVRGYADAIIGSNAAVASSFDAVGDAAMTGLVGSFASVASAALPAVAILGTLAVVAYTVYESWDSIAEVITSAANNIGEGVSSIAGSIAGAISSMIAGTFNWRGAFKDVAETIVTAFAAMESLFQQWQTVGELAFNSILLGLVTFGNTAEHIFTVALPEIIRWFGDNWAEIFTDIASYVATIISNMHENLVRFFTAVFEFLQGDGFSFEWVTLTEGFEATLKELPNIAARELGGLEAELQKRGQALGEALNKGMQENVNNRLGQFQGLFGGKGAGGLLDAGIDKFKTIFNDIGGLFGGKGGGGGRSQQITAPEGESSRFLTGSSAAGAEKLAIEQLALQREATEAAKEMKENTNLINAILKGNLPLIVASLARGAGGTGGISIGD